MTTNVHYYQNSTPDETKAYEAAREALSRELKDLRGDGSIEALQQALLRVEEEAKPLRDNLPVLRAMADHNPGQHQQALTDAYQRLSTLRLLEGAVHGDLRQARQERGEKLARDFIKDGRIKGLYRSAAETRGRQVEAIAALLNEVDQAVKNGAALSQLPALPDSSMRELSEFVAWVATLKRFGVDVTSTLPAAVRSRIDVAR